MPASVIVRSLFSNKLDAILKRYLMSCSSDYCLFLFKYYYVKCVYLMDNTGYALKYACSPIQNFFFVESYIKQIASAKHMCDANTYNINVKWLFQMSLCV